MTDQKRSVRDAYDDLAERYLEERSGEPPELLDEVVDRLPAGSRVLDAGCGQGTPVASSLTDAFDVVGVDFSCEQLRLARENAPGATLVQGDMTALGVDDGTFDAVCAFYSIIHVPVEEHETVLREFARVLRPGGWLLFTVGETAWEGTNPDWLDTGVEMRWSFPAMEETLDHLDGAGFEVVDEWTVDDELGSEYPFVLAKKRDA